jgi:hypothetical protein
MLVLRYGLRKKVKKKEKKIRSANYVEGTLTDIGSKWSKWSKKQKFIGREDRGEHINKEDGSWTTQQVEKATNGCFGAAHGKHGNTG